MAMKLAELRLDRNSVWNTYTALMLYNSYLKGKFSRKYVIFYIKIGVFTILLMARFRSLGLRFRKVTNNKTVIRTKKEESLNYR